MRYFGPTRYLSLSMVAWGSITIGMAFVKNARELLCVRFILVRKLNFYEWYNILDFSLKGMAQAGFFPGIIVYFSLWYRKRDQTMRIAILFGAAIISSALGSVLVCIHRSQETYNAYHYFRHMVSVI